MISGHRVFRDSIRLLVRVKAEPQRPTRVSVSKRVEGTFITDLSHNKRRLEVIADREQLIINAQYIDRPAIRGYGLKMIRDVGRRLN